MCNENSECKCISDILKVISILQKKAQRNDDCDNACDRDFLGCNKFCECNTRPIQFITCGNNGDDPLVMPTSKEVVLADDDSCPKKEFSSVFRVERVDNCCCTCRVLKEEKEHEKDEDEPRFKATDSFFTIDLKCVCVIRCLEDTFVECV